MATFRIKDREYDFDGELTLEESMVLYDKAGIAMGEMAREDQRGNPYLRVFMIYVLKTRAGEATRWQDVARCYTYNDLVLVADDDELPAESEGASESPDPTKADGTETPESGTTNT